jgi:GTPase involved in cell partitioning and DNA repair
LLSELESFDPLLLKRPHRVVLNKIDLVDEEIADSSELAFAQHAVSAKTGLGIESVLLDIDEIMKTPVAPEDDDFE